MYRNKLNEIKNIGYARSERKRGLLESNFTNLLKSCMMKLTNPMSLK